MESIMLGVQHGGELEPEQWQGGGPVPVRRLLHSAGKAPVPGC